MAKGTYHFVDSLEGKVFDRKLLLILWPYARRQARVWLGSLVLVVIATLLGQAWPVLVQKAIDDAITPRNLTLLWTLAALFVGIEIVRFVATAIYSYLLQKLGQNVVFELRNDLFRHLQHLPVSFFDHNPVGRLVTRLTNDVESVTEIFRGGVVLAVVDLLNILVIGAILFWYSPMLALLTLAIMPLMFYSALYFARRLRQAFRQAREKLAIINAFLSENIRGMTEIQLFNREAKHLADFHEVTENHYQAQRNSLHNWAMFISNIDLLHALAMALVIFFGGGLVLQGRLTVGALTLFIMNVQRLFQPIRDMTEKYNVYLAAMASTERLQWVLGEGEEQRAGDETAIDEPRGAIEFKDVWFEYLPNEPVLKGVSFKIEPGETVAIVGATGSGKSTLLNLLTRFYEIKSGQIRIDGVEIRRVDRRSLRRIIGIIPQEIVLFAGPLTDNVTLWNDAITRQRVEEIAELLQCDRFIRRLSAGFDTHVEEAGANLSVGEKQLLSFARVLAYDPAILVLDEATSNIDTQTELLIQEAIETVTKGRTSIIVAHRLSTIRKASRILVLHKGHLVEEGNHASLLAQDGIYAKLHRLQFANNHQGPARGRK